jgi:hypothetical protein
LKKNTNDDSLSLSKISLEIVKFDTILEHVQELFPENTKIFDKIMHIRDSVFQLQQLTRGVEIEIFAGPWIDPEDGGVA